MARDTQLLQAAEDAMRVKYGSVKLFENNNQCRLGLPNSKKVIVKTGSKGQVMQRAYGEEVDSKFIGTADADIVVIAVRNSPDHPIRVFEVPGDVYRNRMKSTYAELLESKQLKQDELRVLRFDGKGYPEQRVTEEWAQYMIYDGSPSIQRALVLQGRQPPQDPKQAVEVAKAIVANAFGIPVEKVSISVNM